MKIFLTGASAGIGRESARILCLAGHEVWGSSRDSKRLPDFSGFHPLQLDLRDRASFAAAVDLAWKESGGIDVLINNAGQAAFGPLDEMPSDMIRDQFELLFFAPLELQRLFVEKMKVRGSGLVIHVSSLAAELPIPFMGAYSAAKAALSVSAAALRLEMRDDRIRYVDLRPGDIGTDFNGSVARGPGDRTGAAKRAWLAIEDNMAAAPPAALVGEKILKIVEGRHRSPVQRVGDWFQARLSPFGPRLLPAAVLEKIIRKYYRID